MGLGVPTVRPRAVGQVRLAPGSTLLLYTDGLIERRAIDLDEMTARLETVATELAEAPLPAFCDDLLAQSLPDTSDDIAILAVRLPGPR
jgi:serine phosphatase RsbU (regulator of sigma subunit)